MGPGAPGAAAGARLAARRIAARLEGGVRQQPVVRRRRLRPAPAPAPARAAATWSAGKASSSSWAGFCSSSGGSGGGFFIDRVKMDKGEAEEQSAASSRAVRDEDVDDEDEYKNVDTSGETYVAERHVLESGRELREVAVRYKTFGKLSAARDNVLVVCHALTGNAALDSWWGSMLGEGKLFDDSKMFVVCANILGSCYGTCGPTSTNPDTGRPYGADFPDVTVRDSVSLHIKLLKEHLGVRRVACVVGGSLGGMQTLEWAALGGADFVGAIIPMCCGAFHHPWQIGISEAQRQAIYADPAWRGGAYLAEGGDAPRQGLSVARGIAMITYRSHSGYSRKFGRHTVSNKEAGHGQGSYFQVESYLRHQGEKFCSRFDALSYVKVTRMMDSHDIGRGRPGAVVGALKAISQPALVIAVSSDILYPPLEQKYLCAHLPNSALYTVESDHGHDGFLLDQEDIMPVAVQFLEKHVYTKLQQGPKL